MEKILFLLPKLPEQPGASPGIGGNALQKDLRE
jgi:hypothetical protein